MKSRRLRRTEVQRDQLAADLHAAAVLAADRRARMKALAAENAALLATQARLVAALERLLVLPTYEAEARVDAARPLAAGVFAPNFELVHKVTGQRIRLVEPVGDGFNFVHVPGSGQPWWIAPEDLCNEYTVVFIPGCSDPTVELRAVTS